MRKLRESNTTKGKLSTCANKEKVVTVKIRNQFVNIKAERKLMSRFTDAGYKVIVNCEMAVMSLIDETKNLLEVYISIFAESEKRSTII